MPGFRNALIASTGIVFVLAAQPAQAQVRRFNVPAQAISLAIPELARQAGIQIVAPADGLEAVRSRPVQGTMDVRAALRQMLEGTGLVIGSDSNGVILLRMQAAPLPKRVQPSATGKPTLGAPVGESAGADIVVTAQKREERLQNVPISVSVLSGTKLDSSTSDGATEALRSIPAVATVVDYQGGGTSITIRGVSAGAALFSGSSPVSYYLDSVPFGFVNTAIAPDANVYDLERIEVLRGPQGTLYGASAQNGVVKILTHDADLGETEIKARGLLSDTKGGGLNYRLDAATNIPIGDKAALRLVAGVQDSSGWIDKPNDRNANDSKIYNVRAKLKLQPTDRLSLGLSAWLSRSDFGAPSVSGDDGTTTATGDEAISTDYDVYGFKASYDLGDATLNAVTGYLDYHNIGAIDSQPFGFPGSLITQFDSKVFSQELLLTSAAQGNWRWSIGGMYRDATDKLRSTFPPYIVDPTGGTNNSESAAIFGEVTRMLFSDKLEITGGLRYFNDTVKQRDLGAADQSKSVFHALSPRAVLTWHPSTELTVYTSYSEGFRSGFNQSSTILSVDPNFPPARPDTLHNYEVGAKGSLFGGRLVFDLAGYYIHWSDVQQKLQIRVSGAPFNAIINSGSASGPGFEMSVTGKVADGMTVGGSFSWNNLTVDQDIFAGNNVLLFAKGDRLNQSPKYTASGFASYEFPLSDDLTARLGTDASFTSRQDERTVDGVFSIGVGDPIFVANARLAIASSHGWTATAFVDNLNNEDRAVWREESGIPVWAGRVRPRTVGLQLEYRY